MHPATSPTPDDLSEQIAALVRTLHETEQRLQTLTKGGMDAFVLPMGESYLLGEAQGKLGQSEEQFRQLAENITDVFWIRSADMSQLHYVSPAFEQILGRPMATLQTHHQQWADFIHAEDRERVLAAFAGLVAKVPKVDIEYRILRPDGGLRWVQVRGFKVRDAAGKVIRLVGIVTDITERRQAREQLRILETCVAHLSDLVIITEAEPVDEPGPRIVFVNNAFVQRTGYTRAEAVGRSPRFLQGPNTQCPALDRIRAAMQRREPVQVEVINYTKSGKEFWLDLKIVPITDASGKVTHFAAVERDITERKLAEMAMRESEERFSSAFLLAPIGMALVSPSGRWLKVNRALCLLVGYSEIELLTRTFQDITHPDDLAADLEQVRQLLAGETHAYQMEKRYIHAGGHFVTVLLHVSLVRDGRGEPLYFISQIQDITERKLVEELLHASEERHRLMFQMNPLPLFVYDQETYRFLAVNQTAIDAYGYSEAEFLAMTIKDIRPAEDTPRLEQALKALEPGKKTFGVWRHRKKNGEIINVEISSDSIVFAGRQARLTLANDITERKKAESALVETSASLESLLENTSDQIYFKDLQSRMVRFSKAFSSFWHLNHPDEVRGKTDFDFFTEEHARSAFEAEQEIIRTGISITNVEEKETHLDGRVTWALTSKMPWRDLHGNIIGTMGISRDITDRKRAELELFRTNRALQMLSAGNEHMIRAESEQELLNKICRMAVEIGNYRMVWVGYARADDCQTIQPVAHAGEENGYFAEIELSWSENQPAGRGPAGRTIRSGQPVVCEDMLHDASLTPWHTHAKQRGYHGVICLPLNEGGRTFGLLGLYAAEVVRTDAGELKLLKDLAEDLAFGIVNLRARNERQRVNEKVREQAALLEAASDAIILKDMEDQILFWNRGAEQVYGWTAAEAVGKKSRELLSADPAQFDGAVQILLQKNRWRGEMQTHAKDGRILMVEARWTLVRDEAGHPKSILAINTDITERKKLESQFLRVQRMESIGTLAGGVAHDLNNMLAPITMSIQMLLEKANDEESRALLGILQASAQRGTDLVKQVLSFARGVEGQRVSIKPDQIIREIQKIIRDTFPKNITFSFDPGRDAWMVIGDPTQLHQVLMNLCVNARDAMPAGGKLTVSLENVVLDEVDAGMNPKSKPGAYVLVKVADTGLGIPAEIRDKIFEPFFTTKEIGKGTGLGLSTTQAIIKSHDGFIHVYSEPGHGSVFKIYLPAQTFAEAAEKVAFAKSPLPCGQGELVLIVDDEEGIRLAARKTLEHFGYRVLMATNGAEAVSLYARHGDEIAVVLTDMAMPVMDGPSTIIALKVMNPKVRIIGTSGHSSKDGVAKAVGAGVEHFIPKPYTADKLLKTLAEALQTPPKT